MAKFQVTFQKRDRTRSTLVIEDVTSTGAMQTADFFSASHGKPISAKKVAA